MDKTIHEYIGKIIPQINTQYFYNMDIVHLIHIHGHYAFNT